MGTRSATGIRYQGGDKLSYNQSDGYPDGVGQDVVNELRAHIATLGYEAALDDLRTKALALRLVDEQDAPTAEDFAAFKDAHDPHVSTGKDWYSLLHDDQGSILRRLNRGVATDGKEFLLDSLFCEYAYILNLENAPCLEVYRGFQKAAHDEGRYGRVPLDPADEARQIGLHGHAWYPVALIATFPLAELPENLDAALPKEPDDEAAEQAA